MENIYNIVRRDNLNYILPTEYCPCDMGELPMGDTCIIIHLHYMDTLTCYMDYIRKIPEAIDVYLTLSSDEMETQLCEALQEAGKKNCRIIRKENRGRDISALLVACRETICRYQYVCFVHDKKEKSQNELYRKETQLWVESMWESMLATTQYICNVLKLLKNQRELGVLAPPQIACIRANPAFDYWGENYENTVELAHELGITDCNLEKRYPPITIGTVFWCRREALDKIWKRNWEYTDFMEEPLPDDGTRSHAIERILGYAAQDLGYKTGYVMPDRFAAKYMMRLEDRVSWTYEQLIYLGIHNTPELIACRAKAEEKAKEEKIVSFMKKNEVNYFYGAGQIGEKCLQIALRNELRPEAFIVSQRNGEAFFGGIPVYEINEIVIGGNAGVVVTAGRKNQEEIISLLQMRGIKNFITYCDEV